jgi:diadenosine tetraphosphate (Ap4A) HIT family hydrolase
MGCVMCEHASGDQLVAFNALAAASSDGFPVAVGHTLIVPRRHEPDFLALTAEEQVAIWALVSVVCRYVGTRHGPDGYSIGINVGPAAGQTVEHAHLHVIPRYKGDVSDPRGGIRWIIPAKARYWESK